ncbi:MAG: AAA family ATPase [Pseudomonadota bacterium]
MLIRSLQMRNFLSYGPDSAAIPLKSLNLLIGPNGSGKSNLLEGIAFIQSAPGQLNAPIREGGGSVRDWLWKGTDKSVIASLEIIVEPLFPNATIPLRYCFDFTESGKRFEVVDERIENVDPYPGHLEPYFYYHYENNHPVLNTKMDDKDGFKRNLRREDVDPEKSIMAQRRDPDIYPEITRLAEQLSRIRIYRDWSFGRYTPPRLPQPTDLQNQWLEEKNACNLGLVLNRLKRHADTKARLREMFKAVYAEVQDFDVMVEGGSVQVFVQEDRFNVPATRLSDGTLHYLCLLAILFDPTPPPLICIDEPELGLHPDLINNIADALRFASEKTQLIVTTHSTALVDAFTEDPESILVCEKVNGCSSMRRLDVQQLKPWLEKYRLGALWTSGEIGGTRW